MVRHNGLIPFLLLTILSLSCVACADFLRRDPVILAVGDIADCTMDSGAQTAKLLDSHAGTILSLGDNAYPKGRPEDFANCYAPTWGKYKARTRPVPGNHDYMTASGAAYFKYFGAAAGQLDKGYYSFDLGTWHIIALNGEIDVAVGSPQEQWLRADLASHRVRCTLAYWHEPRFSSGPYGNDDKYKALWNALYEYDADIVLNGHSHNYERFALLTPVGELDLVRGMREFVVGTGGEALYEFPKIDPNSETRDNTSWGILQLTLRPTSYDWQFIPVAGNKYTDSGHDLCR